MLSSLKSITNFGVFDQHEAEVSFLRFNLIYGWNGSGKSTLSRVFDCLSGKPSKIFPDGNYKVCFQNLEYTRSNIEHAEIKIATFNQDFIKNNLNFENHKAKSILYISEERIEEKKILEEMKSDLKLLKDRCNQEESVLKRLMDEISSEYSKVAKNVKNSFGLIQTKNSKFLNYDKRKLESFLKENEESIKEENILSAEIIEKTKLAAQATQKESLRAINWPFDADTLKDITLKAKEVVRQSIVASQIRRLSENEGLNKWVEEGLRLHKQEESKHCEFCNTRLPPERMEELEDHFSDEYQSLISNLATIGSDLSGYLEELEITFPDSGDFYAEFRESIKKVKDGADRKKSEIRKTINMVLGKIEEKRTNPFKILEWEESSLEDDFDSLEKLVGRFNEFVSEHNRKTSDFETSVNEANDLLELHFICEQLCDGLLQQKKRSADLKEKELKELFNKRDNIEGEVKALESKLVNVAIAADKFNRDLENFVGRSDIQLEFKKDHGGYLFYRNGRREVASNLSEGEKTAIAFIYFITKLEEVGSSIEDTIVVLDDPISSFDSKNLHSAFGFIHQRLGDARQLFVLTHNFEFFKLVRNWLKRKNSPNAKGVRHEKAKFYLVQANLMRGRKSEIVSLPVHLLNYESEYHFLFERVWSFKDKEEFSFEEAHFIGNCSRKILEAFLAFKFPSYKSDFAGLLQKACEDDSNLFQRVFSFINRYSHSQTLEVFEGGSDNIFAESQNIVSDVFEIIENLDKSHFDEMRKLCS